MADFQGERGGEIDQVAELAKLLRDSQRTLVFTGAGVSTDSGIPDYRGPQGVWNTRRPVEFHEFLADPEARVRYWTMKLEDYDAYRDVAPSATHRALVAWDRAGRLRAVVTQNVDGLHARAGLPPKQLVELHGTNFAVACTGCERREAPEDRYEEFRRTRRPPHCACGGPMKPATISFGQSLRSDDLERASRAAIEADLVVALGTTLSVTPAAHVPLQAAARGIPYVIVNRGPTEHDRLPQVRLRLEGGAAEFFAAAVERVLA